MNKNTTPDAGNQYPDLPPGRRRQPMHVEHIEHLADPTDTPRSDGLPDSHIWICQAPPDPDLAGAAQPPSSTVATWVAEPEYYPPGHPDHRFPNQEAEDAFWDRWEAAEDARAQAATDAHAADEDTADEDIL